MKVWMQCTALLAIFLLINGTSCNRITYVCDQKSVEFRPGMVLVAPGYTSNPGLVRANCSVDISTRTGIRLQVQVYQKFSVSGCGINFVQFFDGIASTNHCGTLASSQLLFTTSTNALRVWYKSDSSQDKVGLSLRGFGCPIDEMMIGDHYKLSYDAFTPTQSFYRVKATCDRGYLINGTNATSTSLTCEYISRYDEHKWQDEMAFRCEPSTCASPAAPEDGEVRVSGLEVTSTARYRCDPGYKLIGVSIATCSWNENTGANWSHPTPECHVKDCGPLVIPNADYTTVLNTTYKSVVIYSCADSTNRTSLMAVCTQEGVWTYQRCVIASVQSTPVSQILKGETNAAMVATVVAVTLLTVLIIIIVVIVVIKRRQDGKNVTEFDFAGPRGDSPQPVYQLQQSDKGESTYDLQPESVTVAPPQPAARRAELYSQVQRSRGPPSSERADGQHTDVYGRAMMQQRVGPMSPDQQTAYQLQVRGELL